MAMRETAPAARDERAVATAAARAARRSDSTRAVSADLEALRARIDDRSARTGRRSASSSMARL
ncbi:MAG: hypothetical protein DWI58_09105 [Chloroflexi bacterium]|nr:MAG: hypothetical protein DWI58_09105 [Chloroflexota bacterium]